ncbi:MAG: hypothetical protein WCG16_12680 [Methylococcales bacterium]
MPLEIWLDLPKHLDNSLPYLDTQDMALLYVFDLPNDTGKVVIRMNHLEKIRDAGNRKKISSNFIKTGGIIVVNNIQESRYTPLLDKKP